MHLGRVLTEEHKQKIRIGNTGKVISNEHKERIRNHNLGLKHPHTNDAKRKISENHSKHMLGKHHSDTTKAKISAGLRGRKASDSLRMKRRNLALERIQTRSGQVCPAYNPTACKLFDQINAEMNWRGVHAENGGEYHIKDLGYFVDYYEPTHNIVIEYDEPYHCSERMAAKDERRQTEIIAYLNCRFVRIPEREASQWKQFLK